MEIKQNDRLGSDLTLLAPSGLDLPSEGWGTRAVRGIISLVPKCSPTTGKRSAWGTIPCYGVAAILVATALLLSLAAHRFAPSAFVYLFLTAVVGSAWLGSTGPGLFAALLAALTLDFYFLLPLHTFGINGEAYYYVFPFLLSALGAAWVSSKLKVAMEESARFTCAIDQAADSIVITDTDACIQYVNPAFTRLTGYSPQEVIGKSPNILKSGRQNPMFYRNLWDTIRAGQVWHGKLINRRKDGALYTEEMLSLRCGTRRGPSPIS